MKITITFTDGGTFSTGIDKIENLNYYVNVYFNGISRGFLKSTVRSIILEIV